MGKILPGYLFIFTFFTLMAFGQTEQQGENLGQSGQPFVETPLRRVDNPVQFYPNPSEDHLIIDIKDQSLKNVELEVYNIIGNAMKIEVEDRSDSSVKKYKINVRSLMPGYYLLVVSDKDSRFKQAYKFQKK